MNPAAGGQNTPQDAGGGGPVSGGRDAENGAEAVVWPDRLDDVSDRDRWDLITADVGRYMRQARAEADEYAEQVVQAELRRRVQRRRSHPWWSWRRWAT